MDAPVLRKTLLSALLIVGILFLGFLSLSLAGMLRADPVREETPPPPLAVSGLILNRDTVVETIRGYGLAEPINRAQVSAQVAGTVVDVPERIRVGARVEAGEVLAFIDPITYRAEADRQRALLAEARENLARVEVEIAENQRKLEFVRSDIEIAQAEFERAERLLREGVSSPSARDQAQSALQAVQQRLSDVRREEAVLLVTRARSKALLTAQESALVLAEQNLDFTQPVAPFAGVVEERFVDGGDFVQPGAPLVTLVDTTRLEMPIEVPASQAAALREGAPARLQTDTRPPAIATGYVERISPTIRARNRTVGAYIVIDSADFASIAPGAYLKATIDGRTFEDVFAVPRSAIVDGRIMIDQDGTAREVTPEFFAILDEVALTRDPLPNPVTLIINGFEQLYDGAPVIVETPRSDVAEP